MTPAPTVKAPVAVMPPTIVLVPPTVNAIPTKLVLFTSIVCDVALLKVTVPPEAVNVLPVFTVKKPVTVKF